MMLYQAPSESLRSRLAMLCTVQSMSNSIRYCYGSGYNPVQRQRPSSNRNLLRLFDTSVSNDG